MISSRLVTDGVSLSVSKSKLVYSREKFHLVELNILKNFIETTKKFFTFDVSTSIRGLHQKKLVLGLLLPVLGTTG